MSLSDFGNASRRVRTDKFSSQHALSFRVGHTKVMSTKLGVGFERYSSLFSRVFNDWLRCRESCNIIGSGGSEVAVL